MEAMKTIRITMGRSGLDIVMPRTLMPDVSMGTGRLTAMRSNAASVARNRMMAFRRFAMKRK